MADRVVGTDPVGAADDRPDDGIRAGATAVGRAGAEWLAFAYLAAVSMFLAFFAWYRGLAIGPIAQVSQARLPQPVMTIVWAAVLLGEQLTLPTVLGGFAVVTCAALAVRTRTRTRAPLTS